ncbi:von Willebrand factor type A domain protein [Novipirellula galeiformis]|uniref:von Willebrand factor type A domain protein n=1 Tax=Novipirellula galeiformis TaxID=2528004 RepID=A0A5C6C7Q0_9BACT|nr:vWA domain-containing protein [Novipirellula galeiformis]TWU20660.1 von Willebrand factor type A domain protein [Novipirellula galeiformis]
MQTILKFVVTLALVIGFVPRFLPTVSAQDITITIEKGDEKTSSSTKKSPFSGKRPSVDVAILLDTSNSMDGLIDQAKSQLWNIVQDFAKAKKKGKTPLLRVSVFEYGNSGLPASEGYIRQVVQLTDDLDKVSEALFALRTNGGDEYCGAVIQEAIKRLDWSKEPNAYKAIFIAGNEPFTQGSVDYRKACKKAIGAGVVVNTIHCGDYQQGVDGKWKEGAELAEGEYLNIDQDEKVVHIKCPQDKIIIKLNRELNQTYLWYGSKDRRMSYAENQAVQDSNASGLGGLSVRAATKSSSVYRNVGRDLVDTYEEDKDAVLKIKADELPEALQKLAPAERLKHVESMAQRRAEIKAELAAVSKERQAYLDAERSKIANESDAVTLGDAISAAVKQQLKASGFQFEK